MSEHTKNQTLPCGCILCICEDPDQCHGCGAKSCGKENCDAHDYIVIKRFAHAGLVEALRKAHRYVESVSLHCSGCKDTILLHQLEQALAQVSEV